MEIPAEKVFDIMVVTSVRPRKDTGLFFGKWPGATDTYRVQACRAGTVTEDLPYFREVFGTSANIFLLNQEGILPADGLAPMYRLDEDGLHPIEIGAMMEQISSGVSLAKRETSEEYEGCLEGHKEFFMEEDSGTRAGDYDDLIEEARTRFGITPDEEPEDEMELGQ